MCGTWLPAPDIWVPGNNLYHLDHIWPLSAKVTGVRGTNWPENLNCLCSVHNFEKHDRDPFEWARSLGLSDEDYNKLTKDYEAARPKPKGRRQS